MTQRNPRLTDSDRRYRVMPVVVWLQAGAAVAAAGLALAAAPTAAADDGSTTEFKSAPAESSRAVHGALRSANPSRPSAHHTAAAAKRTAARKLPGTATTIAAAATKPSPAPAVTPAIPLPAPAKASATAQPSITASANTPSAAPRLSSLGAALRLNVQSLFNGGVPKVTNPTVVVKALFNEVLRRDPTQSESDNYVRNLNIFGVNSVVAGLYSSDAFRQNAVNNYYRQILNRIPTQQELKTGVFAYSIDSALGSPESFVASLALAGGKEFYNYSASGGGTYGSQPSATSYVNLLYRSLLGEPAGPKANTVGPEAASLIQRVERGLPTLFAANQFVKADAYRTVKVGQVYAVLGQTATPTDIASYVKNWIWSGGQAGISQSLLAGAANIARADAGLVTLPDVTNAALLSDIMLLPYGIPEIAPNADSYFVSALKQQLQGAGSSTVGLENGCKGTVNKDKCNQDFYTLMTTGGPDRGIPNNALQWTEPYTYAPVSKLLPTQNNVDMNQSLVYPLREPTTAALYLNPPASGQIDAPGGIILTADNGQYVIDGHHRWSALYVVNPNGTSIKSIDLGYVPDPQSALKETQIAIGAQEGYLPWKAAEGPNLYKVGQTDFNNKVYEYIWVDDAPGVPNSLKNVQYATSGAGVDRPIVFNEFMQKLTGSVAIPGVPAGALTDEQKKQYTQTIQDYLWGNVLLMRQTNNPIPNATARKDMPQPEDNNYPPYLNLLKAGNVIYTLPVISTLG